MGRPRPSPAPAAARFATQNPEASTAAVEAFGQEEQRRVVDRFLSDNSGDERVGMIRTEQRHTFTYCKPLLLNPNQPPVELNRLDFKNWTPTPAAVEGLILDRLRAAARFVNAIPEVRLAALAGQPRWTTIELRPGQRW